MPAITTTTPMGCRTWCGRLSWAARTDLVIRGRWCSDPEGCGYGAKQKAGREARPAATYQKRKSAAEAAAAAASAGTAARAARPTGSTGAAGHDPGLHRQQALALQFLARELAGAADGLRAFPRFFF